MGTVQENKTPIALGVSTFVGLAVMLGWIDPLHATDVTNWISAIFGGAIALVSLIGFIHHQVEKLKVNAGTTTASVSVTAQTPTQ